MEADEMMDDDLFADLCVYSTPHLPSFSLPTDSYA